MRRFFRSERAATDPILVIAAIAVSLVLLVGGSFGVSAMIASAKNTNAQKDLVAVGLAEEALRADGTPYVGYDSVSATSLERTTIGFARSAGTYVTTATCPTGWVAAARAATGKVYVATSTHPQPTTDVTVNAPDCFTGTDVPALATAAAAGTGSPVAGPVATNLMTCSSFETMVSTLDCGIAGFFEGRAYADSSKAKFGTKSIRVEQTTDRTNGIHFDPAFGTAGSPEYDTYQHGDAVSVGAWVWVPKGQIFAIGLRSERALSGRGYGTTFTGTGGWQWVAYDYTILPSTADHFYDPVITLGDGTTPAPIGTKMWVDGITLVHSHTALPATPAFQDGDSDGWTWNGAAGASASTGPMRSY
ncbi:hypothetical protein ACWGJ9_11590 [Curtobacterium citreum]